MQIEYSYSGTDAAVQAQAVDMLERCFEEWQDFKKLYGRRFPFIEHSFIARSNGNIIGHVGIMPFEISDGKGSFLRAAGLASVGVAPEARGQGVANKLCLAAAGWAEKENFDLMLLYTGAVKVYEKSSWQIVQAPNCRILSASGNTSSVAGIWKHGSQLSSSEKSFIAECYNALTPLAGRVRRTEDERYFHSWEWTFRNPLNFWRVTADGYALKTDGFLSEAALPAESNTATWQELISGVNQAFLAPQDAIAQELVKLNWNVHPVTAQPGCWHGEMAMQKLLKKSIAKEISFLFPLADKF